MTTEKEKRPVRAQQAEDIIPRLSELFERGFALVPCDGKKVPILRGWNRNPVRSIEEAKRFPRATKWGVVCGHSGVTVVDVDPEGMETLAGWEFDYGPITTLRARTPRGGNHLYFRHVDGVQTTAATNDNIPGIDTRAGDGNDGNGYAIAPPSPGYSWLDPAAEIEEMPDWLKEILRGKGYFKTGKTHTPPPPREAAARGDGTKYALKALATESEKVRKAVEGSRNATLNSAAFSVYQLVAGGELAEGVATSQLEQAARACGLDDDEIAKTLESAHRGGFGSPRGAPKATEVPREAADLLSYHLTEAGNGERFAAYSDGNARYIYAFKQWATWNGRHWSLDGDGGANETGLKMVRELHRQIGQMAVTEDNTEARKRLSAWAFRSENRTTLTNSLALAEHLAKIDESAFDAHPFLINFKNGTLDLRSQSFKPHAREDFLTQLINFDYLPTARADRWERFLSEIFLGREDLIRFIQKAVGYSLTGSYEERCVFILYGFGKNGKSTFLNVLAHVLGPYAGSLNADALMIQKYADDKQLDFAALRAARFVTASECENNKRLAESKIKQLSGGDKLNARFLHKNFFAFTPQFKIWLATNHKPEIRGVDDAIWDRIRLIPFDYRPKPEDVDKRLTTTLMAEAEGILSWAVEGARLWQKEGLDAPECVVKATTGYRAESDFLKEFLEAETEHTNNPRDFITKEFLYGCYAAQINTGHVPHMSQSRFSKALRERGYESARVHGGTHVWIGLARRTKPREDSDDTVTEEELIPPEPWPVDDFRTPLGKKIDENG